MDRGGCWATNSMGSQRVRDDWVTNILTFRYTDTFTPALDVLSAWNALCYCGSEVKASAWNAGDLGSIPGSGRSLEKEMATHSSTLAWRIPWKKEPGGLQSMGSQRVGHDWATSHTCFQRNIFSCPSESNTNASVKASFILLLTLPSKLSGNWLYYFFVVLTYNPTCMILSSSYLLILTSYTST